jgi:hypothetical protein
MSDELWPTCHACGGVINPQWQSSADDHKCGPLEWARHQGALLSDIRAALVEVTRLTEAGNA